MTLHGSQKSLSPSRANGDLLSIQNAYRRVCESAELDALKRRLESASLDIIKQSFYEMTAKEKVAELMKSGAIVERLGSSSRIAMLTSDGTVLKIADSDAGLAQNAAEAYNASEKNAYGCFAKVLWVSRNRFALEMEYAEKLAGSDLEFEEITGINLDKYFDYLRYEKYLSMTPKKRDVVYRAHFSKNRDRVTADLEWIKENHDEIAVELKSPPNTEAKMVLTNLAPATLAGIESQGMILSAEDENGVLEVVSVDKVANGAEVKL